MSIFQKSHIMVVLFLTFLSLYLNIANVTIGLPSIEFINLIVDEEKNRLYPLMKELREEVYSDYAKQTKIELLKCYIPKDRKFRIEINDKEKIIEENKIHVIRSAFLQSRWPDEQKTLISISNIKKELNPRIFHYGGFYIFSCGIALKISEIIGLIKIASDVEYYFKNIKDVQKLYAIPKILGGILAAISVPLVFLIGYRFFSLNAGLIAASFMAVVPSLSVEAHALKPFAFFIPFFLLSLYFSLDIMKDGGHEKKKFFLAGVFSGLSAGTMIFSGISLLFPVAACVWKKKERNNLKNAIVHLTYTGVGFILSFLITNPFYIFAFKEVFAQIRHLYSIHSFHLNFFQMLHYSIYEFHKLCGFPIYILTVSGLIFFVLKKKKEYLVILSVFLPFFIYTSNAHWDAPHYSMLLVPLSVLISAEFIRWMKDRMKLKFFYSFLILFTFIFTLGNSVYYHMVLRSNYKNLIETGKWINENISPGTSLGTSTYPHFGFKSYPPFRILNYSVNKNESPDYFIINDVNYKLKSMNVSYRDPLADEFLYKKNYKLIKNFTRQKNFLDKFYKNYLYIVFEQEFKIYSKV